MKKFAWAALALWVVGCAETQPETPLKAFPTAEGYGAYTPGGRGGKVYTVTNLNDAGLGSLREAIEAEGPRTVVFNTDGMIELQSDLVIRNPHITIAGQTAPGDGICLKNYPLDVKGTHDVIIRGIRIRPGIDSGLEGSHLDGIEVSNSQNVIIDHCTISWSNDEAMNTWKGVENITVQWCLVSEPLNRSVHSKGAHGYSATLGGVNASFHHNLFAHGPGRNPSIGGNHEYSTINMDLRNNVFYNFGHRTADGKPRSINMVNNYYKPGPATQEELKNRLAKVDNASAYKFQGVWYIDGNVMEGNPAISTDNWNGVVIDRGLTEEEIRATEPYAVEPVTTQTADEAYEKVLAYAGTARRDKQEKRVIEETRTGTAPLGTEADGVIDSVEQAGGYPQLAAGKPWTDADADGLPDDWEKTNKLNPTDPADAAATAKNGYTNIENWFNSLIPAEQ
jgi:hypothetical protein